MVYKLFDKKSVGSGNKNEITQNQQLAEELRKQIIRNFFKKVYSSFEDNIWGADLVDIQLISKFNKVVWFLLCVIDTYSKYAWIIPLKDKKSVTIANSFQSTLNDSKRKPNKIWVDKGSKFYNGSMESWLEKK